MDETHRTLHEIADSIRRRCRTNGALAGLVDALCAAGVIVAVVIVATSTDGPIAVAVWGSLTAATATALLSGRRRTPTAIEAIRRADREIRAKGLLPSAWEVLEGRRGDLQALTALERALVRRAATAARRVETSRVVPFRLPPRTPFFALALALPILAVAARPYLSERDATPVLMSWDAQIPQDLLRPDERETSGQERLALTQRLRRSGGERQRPERGTDRGGRTGEILRFEDAMRDLAPGDALTPGRQGGRASGEVESQGFLRAVPPDGTGGVVLLERDSSEASRTSPAEVPGTEAPTDPERNGDERSGGGGTGAPSGPGAERGNNPAEGGAPSQADSSGGGINPQGGEDEGSSDGSTTRPGRGAGDRSDDTPSPTRSIEGIGTIPLELPQAAESDVPVNELMSRARPWGIPGEEIEALATTDFDRRAERILERQDIPESARVFVRDYFLRLDG